MRILLVTSMPPQPEAPGAIPLVLYAQLIGLRERHDVTLLTPIGPDESEVAAIADLRAAGIEVHSAELMPMATRARWLRRWRLAHDWLIGGVPWRTAWFRAPGIQSHLDRLLATEAFDLVQVEDNAMGVYRYPTQIPKVLAEHEVRRPRGLAWHDLSTMPWSQWALRETDWQRWRRYQSTVWSRFDRVQVFTQRDAASVQAISPVLAPRVRVNPFGVALPQPADPLREEAGTLLFVGNYTHPPNVDAALWLGAEIMPILRARHPGVRLWIVGIDPPEAVRALVAEDIVVTGRVPTIEPYLSRAAVVLAPIRIGGGMRMKVLHAMALGKAVVTTPRGAEGLADVGHKPPLRIAGDAESFASETAALLQSIPARQQLGQAARAFVAEHYSPAAYVRRLEMIYAELCEGRGG
jgi:glycosyltransferase involved in cell wall biosynthesis